MNISEGEQYIKYPYIITLKKYWLEYKDIDKYPEYKDILSDNQIKSLLNILRENTLIEDYISGGKWEDNIIENTYLYNFMKKNIDKINVEEDFQEIQEKEIKKIFNQLYEKKQKNKGIFIEEDNKDLSSYRLFFSFANLSWITIENDAALGLIRFSIYHVAIL